MKEVMIKFADEVVEFMNKEAAELGISTPELVRYVVGTYVQEERLRKLPNIPSGIIMGAFPAMLQDFMKDMDTHVIELLKKKAKNGELSCKNCTVKLTEQDVEDKKCGTCSMPLKDAIGWEEKE